MKVEAQQDSNSAAGVASVLTDGLEGGAYRVCIRNNFTCEERMFESNYRWEEHHQFMWTEGNYGCDCNRHLFFERAAGNEPELFSHDCGDDHYSVLYAEFQDGTRKQLDESSND